MDSVPDLEFLGGPRADLDNEETSGHFCFAAEEAGNGDLVLAVGTGAANIPALVEECATRGAVAVVVRNGAAVLAAVPPATVPVLALSAGTTWAALVEAGTRWGEERSTGAGPTSTDLFGLVDAIALASGGSAVIEDSSRRVVAYSSIPGQEIDEERARSILGRAAPHVPSTDGAYRTVWAAPGVVRVEAPGYAPRLATAVRVGVEPLGVIWVMEGTEPLSDDAKRVLERSVTSAGWYLLAARQQAQPRTPRELAIVAALRGEDTAVSVPVADSEQFMVGCCVVDGPPLTAARVAELANLDLGAPSTHVGKCVLTALQVTPGMAPADRRRLETFAATARRHTGADVKMMASETMAFAMISPTAAEMRRIAESSRDFASLPEEVSSADVRRMLLTSAIAGAVGAAPELGDPQLAALAATEPELARTLLIYLEAHSDTVETARRLGLHENTVRYRLRRAQDFLGSEARKLDLLTTLAQLRAWSDTHL